MCTDPHDGREAPVPALEAAVLAAAVSERDDVFFVLDRDLRHVVFNEAYAGDFRRHYGVEVAAGTPFGALMTEDDRAAVLQVAGRALAGERVSETIAVDADVRRTYETTWAPLRLPDGSVGGVVVRVRDVTELGRAEEAEEQLRALAENSGDPVFVVDREQRLVAGNEAYRRIVVESGEQPVAVGETLPVAVYSAEARALWTGWFERAFAGELVEAEFSYRSTSGESRDIEVSLRPATVAGGCVASVVVTAHDVTRARATLRRLAESEERYRLIAEHAADVVGRADADGVIRWMSPSVKELTGWEPDDLVGKTVFDFLHPDDLEATRGRQHLLASGAPVTAEVRLLCADGTYRWVSSAVRLLRDEHGVPAGRIAAWRDVAERHAAEEALAAREQRLRSTLDSMFDPHVLLEAVRDEDGHIVDFLYADANDAACAYNGRSRDELVGARLLDLLPGHAAGGLLSLYSDVVETGEPLVLDDLSYEQELLGGAPRRYDVRGVRVGDGLSYTWRDVTERYEAAQRLAASEDLFRSLFETMAQGVVIQDAAGSIVAANFAAEQIVGLTLDQMRGLTSFDPRWRAVREDGSDLPGEEHPMVIALRDGTAVRDVTIGTFNPRDECVHWALVTAVPQFRPGAERPHQAFAVFTDITEVAAAEAALRESEDLFRNVFEGSPVGIGMASPDGRVTRVNEALSGMLGYTREELEGVRIDQLIPPDDVGAMRERMRDLFDGTVDEVRLRRRFLHKDGSAVWTDGFTTLRRDDRGEPRYFVTSVVDITEQVASAQTIVQLQETREIAEHVAHMGSWRYEPADGRAEWSPEMYRIHDLEPGALDEGLHNALADRLHPDDVPMLRATVDSWFSRGGSLDYEYRVVHRDGSVHIIHTAGSADDAAGLSGRVFSGFSQDVTEARDAESEVRRTQADRAMTLERQRLARDLHDAVTQNLYSADMLLALLPAAIEDAPAEAVLDAEAAHRAVRAALGELRTLLSELRPDTIARTPLSQLLARLGDALAGSAAGLDVVTTADDALILPAEVHVTFYRVAQEALANVRRHACAAHAAAVLEATEDGVRLEVRDDGVGYDTATLPRGLGIGIMRERAHDVGARLVIESAPGAGTTVTLSWAGETGAQATPGAD